MPRQAKAKDEPGAAAACCASEAISSQRSAEYSVSKRPHRLTDHRLLPGESPSWRLSHVRNRPTKELSLWLDGRALIVFDCFCTRTFSAFACTGSHSNPIIANRCYTETKIDK